MQRGKQTKSACTTVFCDSARRAASSFTAAGSSHHFSAHIRTRIKRYRAPFEVLLKAPKKVTPSLITNPTSHTAVYSDGNDLPPGMSSHTDM
jgi:hypothetical protein